MRNSPPLKIAVIGTGISGLSAAWLLSRAHQVTVYEQDHRTGGHANTVFAGDAGQQTAVDTGFIVFNRRTYPNFSALLDCLGVATHKSGSRSTAVRASTRPPVRFLFWRNRRTLPARDFGR
jgi:predicted NAD/FAD-binding protein